MSMNSKEIEERVVSMRFDNEQFEKGTKQTISTLEKLKSSLNFTGAVKGLSGIASETNVVKKNMDVLSSGVNSIKSEFDSLSVIGATALVRLTNAAITAGKNMVNALTLDPVKTGFSEYEEKMGSIQTILTNTASKGTTLDEVVKTLDELNTYADKTIYNFAQMTKNIGTFTAAGLDLETSANSIQGIANLAAASGSTSQQASTAMYQLSQALSAGSLKLQDWNSVVNAGMGGQLFQNALKETAKEYGIDVDAIIEETGSFRESLSKGWISADILSTTLRKFTRTGAKEYADSMQKNGKYTEEQTKKLEEQALMMENAATEVKTFTQLWDTLKETAQSGWGKTWEIIIGDYDQAKKTFTEINNIVSPMIEKVSDSINNLFEGALGSQSKWDSIVSAFGKASIGIDSIKKAFAETYTSKGIISDISEFDALLDTYNGNFSDMVKGLKEEGKDSYEYINLTREALKQAIRDNADYSESTLSATQKLEHFQNVVSKVWAGDYGNQSWNKERQKALEAEGYNYDQIQRLVNIVQDAKSGLALTEEDLNEEDLRSLGLTKEEIKAFKELQSQINNADSELNEWIASMELIDGRTLLFQALVNTINAVKTALGAVAQGVKESFPDFASKNIYDMIVSLEKFTKSLILNDKQINIVKNGVRIFINLLETARYILGTGLRLALAVVKTFLEGLGLDVGTLVEKLADGTQTLRDFVKQQDMVAVIMERIGPYIRSFGEWIGGVIKKVKNGENIFSGLGDAILNTVESLASKCPPLINNAIMSVVNFFKRNVSKDFNPKDTTKKLGSLVDEIKTKLNELNTGELTLGEVVIDVFSNLKFSDGGLVDKFKQKILPKLKKAFEWLVKHIKGLWDKVSDWLKNNFDPGAAIAGVMIYSILKMAKDFIGVLDSFASPFEQAQEMIESIAGMFNALKKRINASTKNLKVQNFLIISTAIFMISMAIRQLATLPIVNVAAAAASIALLTIALGAMASIFTAVNKTSKEAEDSEDDVEEVENHFGLFAGMALMMLAMAKVLTDLSTVKWDDLGHALLVMLTCIASFIVVIYAMTKLGSNLDDVDLDSLGNTLIAFGASMILLVNAVKMAGTVDRGTLKKGTAFVLGAALVLKILANSLKGASGTFAGAAGVGVALIACALAMKMLVGVVKTAAEIDTPSLLQALKVMATVELLMLGFVAIIGVSKLFGGGGVKLAISLLAMTVAMALIPAIVKAIASITPEEMKRGLLNIANIMILFVGFMAATRLVGTEAHKISVSLLALSLSVGLLVGTIALIGLMKPMTIAKGIGAVSLLVGFMALFAMATKDVGDATRTLTALGVAVAILAGVVVALSFLKPEKAYMAVSIVGILLLTMAAFVASTKSLASDKIGPLIIVIGGMLMLIVAVSVLAATISDAIKDDPANTIAGIVAAASMVIAACIGAYFMSKAAAFAKHASLKSLGIAAVAMVGMIAICWVLSKLIGTFGGVDLDGIKKAAPGLLMASILTALCVVAAVFIMKQLNGVKMDWGALGQVGILVGGLIVVMAVMGILISGITNLPIKTNGEAWAKLAMVALMTAFVCGIAAFLGKVLTVVSTSTKKLGVLAGIIGTVAGALLVSAVLIELISAGLANVQVDGNFIATLGLVALFAVVMLTAGALLATFVTTVKITKPQLTKLITLMAVVAAMMVVVAGIAILIAHTVLPVLDGLEHPGTIMTKVAALCVILVALAVVAFMCAGIAKLIGVTAASAVEAIPGIAVAAVLIAAVALVAWLVSGTVMKALDSIEGTDMMDKAMALCAILLALSVVALICGVIGTLKSAAFIGAGALATLAVVVEGAILAFAKFVGPQLPIMGSQIASFGESMKEFADNISGLSSENVDSVGRLISIMTELGGLATTMDMLNLFHKGWSADLQVSLTQLAACCCAFNKAITSGGGLDADAVDTAKTICDLYVTLAENMPKTGGINWEEKIKGAADFGKFSEDLKQFATAMISFCTTIKTSEMVKIDKKQVQDFCDMAKPIISVQKQLYGTGGWKQKILGEKDLSDFSGDMKIFANSMIELYTTISPYKDAWKDEMWNDFAETSKIVASIGSSIENTGGLVAFLIGDNDMSTFGDGLDNFAAGMKALYDNCGDIDWNTETWQNMNDCMAILGPMIKNYVPKTGGWLDVIKGQQDLDKFGTNISKFGSGIASFAKSIGEDTTSFKTGIAKRCTEDLKAVIEAMPDTAAWEKLRRVTKYITNNELSTSVSTLGGIITTWSKSVATVDNSKISNAADALTSLVSSLDNASNIDFENVDNFGGSLTSIGANTMQGFVDAFENCYERVCEAIRIFSDKADEAYTYNGKYRMIMFGKQMAQHILDGLAEKTGDIKSKATELCDTMYNTFKDYRSHMENIGMYLVNGFIYGIKSKQNNVQSAVDDITNFIGPRMMKNTEEKSPSKMTYRIGSYLGEGLVNGMLSTASMIQMASDDISDTATMSLQEALYNAVTNFDDENLSPTIKPIIDMTDVNAGFNDISSRLSQYTMNVGASVPSLGYSVTNADVVDAIGGLSDILGTPSGDTYNINGITYDDGSNVASAVSQLIYAANIARRS